MSGAPGGGGKGGGKAGGGEEDRSASERDAPVGDTEVDGAAADTSGYRRDDYWREGDGAGQPAPDEVAEPPQGYGFESPEEKAKAADRAPGGGTDADEAAEQGNAGGRDDARIVDD